MKVENTKEENTYSEKEIIRDTTAYSGTLYFSQFLYIGRGFIIAQVLGPAMYGVWSIFRSVFASVPYFGLGTQEAMLREVPFSIGGGNKQKKSIIIQTSLSWNLLLTSIVMILAIVLSFTSLATEYKQELRLAGILFVLNALQVFIRTKFKSEQKILLLSKFIFSYAVLNTVFGLALLFFFKLNGLLMGMIMANILLFFYIIIKKHLSLHLLIDKNILNELFKIGLPIMILSLLLFLIGTLDKFFVFIMLGKTKAGYYGLASFVSTMVGYISHSISTVIFPRMMYMYGKTQELKQIEKYFEKPLYIISGLIPIILGIIYINIGAVINLFLPQYNPGIEVLHILIAALFFSTILGIPTNILIALNKQKKFMYMTAIVLILSIILDVVVIEFGFGMNGVALVTTFVFFLSSIIANSFALSSLKNNIKESFWNLALIYLPFIYSFAGMFFIISISFSHIILLDNILKSIIFILFSIPLIFYIEKKSNIISKTFAVLKIFKRKN